MTSTLHVREARRQLSSIGVLTNVRKDSRTTLEQQARAKVMLEPNICVISSRFYNTRNTTNMISDFVIMWRQQKMKGMRRKG